MIDKAVKTHDISSYGAKDTSSDGGISASYNATELLPDAEPHAPDRLPTEADSLSTASGEARRRYSRLINFREGWRGYFWQGRFSSFVIDGNHLLATARYIKLNQVRAKLANHPGDYRWSSCKFGMCEGMEQHCPESRQKGERRRSAGSPIRSFSEGSTMRSRWK